MNKRALLLGALLAVGCGSATEQQLESGSFDGPSGERVTVNSLPVKRIVSTMQSATEWLVRLGAESLLVARTDFDDEPELADLPSIGGGLETSAETIAALNPDVVLGWRIGASVSLARALAPLGIPVVAVEVRDTAEVFRQLATLGRLTGRSAKAESLATSLRADLAELRKSACTNDAQSESALIVLGEDPPTVAAGGSWMSQLLGGACLTNVFADLDRPWPSVSLEAIVKRQPRWLITSGSSGRDERLAEFRNLPGWEQLDAVREGRLLVIDGDLFSRAGPRIADWIRAVRSGLEARRAGLSYLSDNVPFRRQ